MSAQIIHDALLSLPSVKQLEGKEFNLEELVDNLIGLLADDSQRKEILSLEGETAALMIECLDEIISSKLFRDKDIETRSRVFSVISRLSRGCQYLPRSYWIEPATVEFPKEPYTSGTCAEVYKAKRDGKAVAVKVLRTSVQENSTRLKKRFCKEVVMWKHVSCPYLLKFNGVFYRDDVPAIVTPWMSNGHIIEYLDNHPDANRQRLLASAIKGVKYLHGCNIAHGDIKAPNILVSDSTPPMAVLADFGFTRVTKFTVGPSSEELGTVPFMAPELLFSEKFGLEKGVPSKEADVYALGMTIYHVLTKTWPFSPKREGEVTLAVLSGERPPKPENAEGIGMTDALWNLVQECWREDRKTRPDISRILERFGEITGERMTTDSMTGAAGPRTDNSGKRYSVDSHTTSPTTQSSFSHGWSTDIRSLSSDTTTPSTFDIIDRNEVSESKGENPPSKSRLTTKIIHSTKYKLGIRKQDPGKATIEATMSPTKNNQCLPELLPKSAHSKNKKMFGWIPFRQVGQVLVRSTSTPLP